MRVAVALLAGQAALCAVIGWVTFGPPQTGPRSQQPVAPLAAPPLAMPTASVAMPPTPTPSTRAPKSDADRARSTRIHRAPAPPAQKRARTVEERPATVLAPDSLAPEPPAPSPDVAATPPPDPTESGEVQGPVVEGEPCDPEGALGLTVDDVSLRCVRLEDDRIVWQIN